jgi:CBS domain-containing protein
MKIKNLLKTINLDGRDIVNVSGDTLVGAANAEMREKRIGAVVVLEAGRMVGIFSERDVARGLVEHGAGVIDRKVSDLMTADVISCEPDTNISDAVQLMSSHGIRHLPVVEDEALVGFISMRDIFSVYIASLETDNEILREQLQVLASGGKLGG